MFRCSAFHDRIDGLDAGRSQAAFLELRHATDRRAGGGADVVFEHAWMFACRELELRAAEYHLANQAVGVGALHAVFDGCISVGFEEEVDEGRAAARDRAADAHEARWQLDGQSDRREEVPDRLAFLRCK